MKFKIGDKVRTTGRPNSVQTTNGVVVGIDNQRVEVVPTDTHTGSYWWPERLTKIDHTPFSWEP